MKMEAGAETRMEIGMEINIVAAVADNGAIGKGNGLLWHISEDMQYFRELTTGSTVIMGRKTFESIGRPLPKRRNIVISRSKHLSGVLICHSLEEALEAAVEYGSNGTTYGTSGLSDKCFIIGGGEIYRQAMPFADKLYITNVHISPNDADTFFPEISPGIWEKAECSDIRVDCESGLKYEFSVYQRITSLCRRITRDNP